MHIYLKNKFLYFHDYKIKCSIGKRGLTRKKREGDLKTPRGKFKFKLLLYRKDRIRRIRCKIKRKIIQKNMGWCDNPNSAYYNRLVKLSFEKKAEKLYLKKNEKALNKKLSYFIQINIGNENQKSGILPKDAKSFARYCTEEMNLNVIGLMVIPPNDDKTTEYFEKVSNLNSDLGFKELSMGMSADYLEAVKFNSTFLRIGSAILGERSPTK